MQPTSGDNAPFFVDLEVIQLKKNGLWYSDDTEISHEPTRALFNRSLHRDEAGYLIRVGRESKRIIVEDTPFFVWSCTGSLTDGYVLNCGFGTDQPLDPATLRYTGGRLTCLIQSPNIAERVEAKFLTQTYYELLKQAEETSDGIVLHFKKPTCDVKLLGASK